MKKTLKRLVTLTLAICCLMTPIALTAGAEEIQPRLNNTISTFTNMSITSSGQMNIAYSYTGFPGVTTHAIVTTFLEKRVLGIMWVGVDNGQPDGAWVDTFYLEDHAWGRTYQLSDPGTYRVRVHYAIHGSGGAADSLQYIGSDSY